MQSFSMRCIFYALPFIILWLKHVNSTFFGNYESDRFRELGIKSSVKSNYNQGNQMMKSVKTVHDNSQHQKYVGGTKTGTKIGSKRRYLPKEDVFVLKHCIGKPESPLNGFLECTSNFGCTSTCKQDYEFPNGDIKLYITCIDGIWQITGENWSKIPDCRPICVSPCQNNGVCVEPNICHCPENFSGPQCQFEKKACFNSPPMPTNSHRTCTPTNCMVKCKQGYQFPDGSTIANMICKDGDWLPVKTDWVSIPDCQPTCSPPCQNGGNCLSLNTCQCPVDYRGPQCQYLSNVCNFEKVSFNGGYKCRENGVSVTCSIYCQDNIPFEFQPASEYICYFDRGIFEPTPLPQCVYGPGIIINHHNQNNEYHQDLNHHTITHNVHGVIVGDSHYEKLKNSGRADIMNHTRIQEEYHFPKPFQCYTWGTSNYKTFDNLIYNFNSSCTYILMRHSNPSLFNIVIRNSKACFDYNAKGFCHKIIRIYIYDKAYDFVVNSNGNPGVLNDKKKLPLPSKLPDLRFEMIAGLLVVNLDTIGVTMKWDLKNMVELTAETKLWGQLQGLCGNLDGNANNDPITKSGSLTNSIPIFVNSWKLTTADDICDNYQTTELFCTDKLIQNEGLQYCKKIFFNTAISACHKALDLKSLMRTCILDYCSASENQRLEQSCQTLSILMRVCIHTKVINNKDWRTEDICPIQCTGGRIYKSCGSSESQTCASANTGSPNEIISVNNCEEGCFCPDGTVFHNDECIEIVKCPCQLRGKIFQPGETVQKDCNQCTCENGKWTCTQLICGARCGSIGDSHYVTFDERRYDFMGPCSYYLMKGDDYSIEVENTPYTGSILEALNYDISSLVGLPSYTKTVLIRFNETVITMKQNGDLLINGESIKQLPFIGNDYTIKAASSIFIIFHLPNELTVWWDGNTRVYVDAPNNFVGKTKGLCGTFNMKQNDDFLTPEGDVEQNVVPFANKWKTSGKCADITDEQNKHPCEENIYRKAAAEKHCSKLTSQIFEKCHWHVDPKTFYSDCLYDMCSCKLKVSQCLCPILASYATECLNEGVIIEWRKDVRECGIHCPTGQVYRECTDSCKHTCTDISLGEHRSCKTKCVEGCSCPNGQALNTFGECIPITQCPCIKNKLEFPSGFQEIRSGRRSQETCTCIGAVWNCRPATNEEINVLPKEKDINDMCKEHKHEIFTTCEHVEPITCYNMHSPPQVSPSTCNPGCICKHGYVLDPISKECIRPEMCPCHHGGKSYSENETMQEDCNTCQCLGGKWKCTDRVCTGYCVSWGDSHFKTFDGRIYDFQGSCDYVLAKGSFGLNEEFQVSIQNVPCGNTGVTCSKSVTLTVGNANNRETLTLTHDKDLPDTTSLQRITLRKAGIYIIIDVADLDITLQWDQSTRIYVKVNPKWKNRLSGLCGNYNDNQNDDFQTPSGGISEVSERIFGDSWRLHPDCPETVEITDTCELNPHRELWAVNKCGILKSSLFERCHSEVPFEPYLKRCIFDTCACDMGGDCDCLCTAIATYAQECNIRGIPIKWRSQHLCPIQCDENCAHYSPCMSSCSLETCDNTLTIKRINHLCPEDICIEGCQPKLCPEDQIYLNSTKLECVPRAKCESICMIINGVQYNEGDIISQNVCEICYCSRHRQICRGDCTTSTPHEIVGTEATTKLPNYPTMECVTGWSKWFSTKKQSSNEHGEDILEPEIPNNEPTFYQSKESFKIRLLPTMAEMNDPFSKYGVCNTNQMKNIECRVLNTNTSSKEIGLNVECNLEHGLICHSESDSTQSCPEFELRVLCDCELQTTTEIILTETTKFKPETTTIGNDCLPGEIYNDCAVRCDSVCGPYLFELKQQGFCEHIEDCISGCQLQSQNCALHGLFWKNLTSCIEERHCSCIANDGITVVQPGSVYQESNCKICQCIGNTYICDDSACFETTPILETTSENIEYSTSAQTSSIATSTSKPLIITELFTTYTTTTTSNTPTKIPVTEEEIWTEHWEKDENFDLGTSTVISESTFLMSVIPKCPEYSLESLLTNLEQRKKVVFNASSYLIRNKAKYGFLNNKPSKGSDGSWKPQLADTNQYLDITFNQLTPIYGVVMQGDPIEDAYVTSYKVLFSVRGFPFYPILDEENKPQIFSGSYDHRIPVRQLFNKPIEVKIIRIVPLTWYGAISMRIDLLGCSPETTTISISTTPIATTFKPLCTEPMGVDNGELPLDRIIFSSEANNFNNNKKIRLNSIDLAWQPLIQSEMEWVQFDFIEPRLITGLKTKGGPDGWVKLYKIQYSNNGRQWDYLKTSDGITIQKFNGNYDLDTEKVNYFEKPIQAKYIRVLPLSWHNFIQMRIEPIGCFEPYPIVTTLTWQTTEQITTTTTTTEENKICNVCPGVEPPMIGCICKENEWWSGVDCVIRLQCPCIYNYIRYPVGHSYETEDCNECICKLGGISECTSIKCPKCSEKNSRPELTTKCGCICKMCPETTHLCPTNGHCLDDVKWCDGIIDCPDDEINCTQTTTQTPVKITTVSVDENQTVKCQIIMCGPGYIAKKVPSNSNYISNQFPTKGRGGVKGKLPIKGGVKGGNKNRLTYIPRKELPLKLVKVKEECPKWYCVSNKPPPEWKPHEPHECPDVECPDDFQIEYILGDWSNPNQCQEYICVPPPPKYEICEISPQTIHTFDKTTYQSEICNHVLARDLVNYAWDISVKENCKNGFECTRSLIINQDDHQIILYPHCISVNINGFDYMIEKASRIGEQYQAFHIARLDSKILFESIKYHYRIIWYPKHITLIGVNTKQMDQVDGLCGYFNNRKEDDKRTPDGRIVISTSDFIDSWANEPNVKCHERICPPNLQKQAWNTCQKLRNDYTLSKCSDVINTEKFFEHCLEDYCECYGNNSVENNDDSKCRCDIIEQYVSECKEKNPLVDLSTWRIDFNCPGKCQPPFIRYDCYNQRCEFTCENLRDNNPCPIVDDMCFPGCFCPSGLIRQNDRCITPSECRNCECKSLGQGLYTTYDQFKYKFEGNCSYVITKHVDNKFQVILKSTCELNNENCKKELIILLSNKKIVIQQNVEYKILDIYIDDELIDNYYKNDEILSIESFGYKEVNVLLKQIQLEIAVQYNDFTFQIRTSHHLYKNKMEGFCGNCNNDENDDFKMPNRTQASSSNDFGKSWLADEYNPLECYEEKHEEIPKCQLPAQNSTELLQMCNDLLNYDIFEQCRQLVDPDQYKQLCENELCFSNINKNDIFCNIIEKYARECLQSDICVEWTKYYPNCRKNCPNDMEFRTCGPGCVETCDNYNQLQIDSKLSQCQLKNVAGCFCPDGKVLKNNTCVDSKYCKPCKSYTENGNNIIEYYPGDIWEVDKCKKCKCNENGLTECESKHCPPLMVCDKDMTLYLKPSTEEDCCPEYICVPNPTEKPQCDEPNIPVCNTNQILKKDTTPSGCINFVCVCKPKDECESIENLQKPLEPGVKEIIKTDGCCPLVSYECQIETCPEPPECEDPYELKSESLIDQCCPSHNCVIPKNKCVYQVQTNAITGEELHPETVIIISKYENETWSDGPCRECVCERDSNDNMHTECKITTCPLLEDMKDQVDYELYKEPSIDQCCPDIYRVRCKEDDQIYEAGDSWISGYNSCLNISCIQEDEHNVKKQQTLQQCDSNCKLGYKYIEPIDKMECCGKCQQFSCIHNNNLYEIGSSWWSEDYCFNYHCIEKEGDILIEKTEINCPILQPETYDNYIVETISIENQCCNRTEIVGCRDNGIDYQIGEIWPSSDGDACKFYECVKTDKHVTKLEKIEKCNEKCAQGWEYQPVGNINQCCGECAPIACILHDIEIPINSEIQTPDNCTTFKCLLVNNTLTVVESSVQKCPNIDNCPEEYLIVDDTGCCQKCIWSENQKEGDCKVETIPLQDTIGMLRENHHLFGLCENQQPIKSFNECIGHCTSSTKYAGSEISFETQCLCCQPKKYRTTVIDLVCEHNQTIIQKELKIPTMCSCISCG